MNLENKVALVTGGSRGIGRAIALKLASQGAAVAVNYRSGQSEAESVVREITELGGKAISVQADVADIEAVRGLVETAVGQLGGLHLLVNNAGIARDRLVMEMEPNDWLDVMLVNFGGVFNCTRVASEVFARQREGAIVNLSSMTAERIRVGLANYAASKAAIAAFTRCCALEMGAFGIRVNAVLPGFVPTELVGGADAEIAKQFSRFSPLRRLTTPEDVANAVAFLAGSDAASLTGVSLAVDGGVSVMYGPSRRQG